MRARRDGDAAGQPLAGWRRRWLERWQVLPRRQQVLAAMAVGLLLGAMLWWVALAPALATLREAPRRHAALDAQLQQMRSLQGQAQALQTLPRVGRDDVQRALETTVQAQLGNAARLQWSGDGATLTLAGVRGEALAQWLAQARTDARARPTAARLSRNASGLWEGRLTLTLPPPDTGGR
jgi:general secretion pathway protein M